METGRFSSFPPAEADPKNVRSDARGKNAVGVLAIGFNEPKDQESVGGKVTKVILENYLRRPSLKEEALQKLTEFAHDAICVQQAPNYPVECAMGVLMIQDNRFRWITTGDVRIYHFVNGQIMETNEGTAKRLGGGHEQTMPEVLPATEFRKGENSFLICSGSFARAVREEEIENALSIADNAEDWLRVLKNLYEDRCADEPFALMTIFMPEKRKRMSKKAIIIIIVVVVLVVGFVVAGFFRRGPGGQGGPGGPGGPGQTQQGGPGMEPTEPPAPPEGAGEGGERPTKPPQPTQPPEPAADT